jgi:hypothetical protein
MNFLDKSGGHEQISLKEGFYICGLKEMMQDEDNPIFSGGVGFDRWLSEV